MTTETCNSQNHAKDPFANATIAVADTAGSFVGDLVRLAAIELEGGNYEQAEHYLREGLSRDPQDHRCQAYLAVCQAVREPDSRDPEHIARRIIDIHTEDPVGYLALGQIYLQRSRRREAFSLFAEARQLADRERTIRRQLKQVEPRQPAVFSSLPRNHVLNIYGGRLRAFFRRLRSR